MKNIFTLAALCCLSLYSSAQSQRTILIEEFTQASCGSCNPENVSLESMLNANIGKVVAIKYQVDWPGFDPMNLDNPTEANTRRWYYAPIGAPQAYFDGAVHLLGFPSQIKQTDIDARYTVPSPFTIKIKSHISPDWDSMYVNVVYKASMPITATMKGQIVVIEKHIHFDSAPGSNGETDFYDVMKKILPTDAGTVFPASMNTGDSVVVNTAWKIERVYTLSELGIVAFAQNETTKEVLQAGYDKTPLTAKSTYDAMPLSLSFPKTLYCGNSVAPVVTIRNQGSNNLTSLQIKYQVNGGTLNTYHWLGNLGFFQSETVTLPVVNFTNVYVNNKLLVYTEQPNGNNDQAVVNDSASMLFHTRVADNPVHFQFRTGYKGMDNFWELKNSSGAHIDGGTTYANNHDTTIDITWHLPPDCYFFRMNDGYADGINGGYYWLKDSTNKLITLTGTGQFTGNFEETPFEILAPGAGVEQVTAKENILVYPNPSSGSFVVQATGVQPGASVQVFDLLGRLVMNKPLTGHQTTIVLGQHHTGIYSVRVITGTETYLTKVVVE